MKHLKTGKRLDVMAENIRGAIKRNPGMSRFDVREKSVKDFVVYKK